MKNNNSSINNNRNSLTNNNNSSINNNNSSINDNTYSINNNNSSINNNNSSINIKNDSSNSNSLNTNSTNNNISKKNPSNNNFSLNFSIINLKNFIKNLQQCLFSKFYYKYELDNIFISNCPTQMSLIIDNTNYIKEKNEKTTIEDWSIFYFLTLLDKKKEKIFLKHLVFHQNYFFTFKWLEISHSVHIFNSKM